MAEKCSTLKSVPQKLNIKTGASVRVRDLWAKTDLGVFTSNFTAAKIKAHDVVFAKFFL